MSNSMKSKPMVAAMVAGGMLLGGFGTISAVSAQTDDEAPSTDTDTGADAEVETDAERGDRADRGDRSERDGEGRRGKGCGASLEAAAEAIGIEADELKAAIEDGQSIADVAEANGVDVDTVVDAMVAEIEIRLDEKVEAERITEDEAAEKLAEKTERIEARVAGEEVEDADDAAADADDDEVVEGEGS